MHGDEGVFRRWMRFELDTLHSGLVTQRRPLADLLREARPSAPARGGAHAFEPAELQRLAAKLPTELHFSVRLPFQLYVDTELEDSLVVQDRAAAEALAVLGFVHVEPDTQGRVWLARAVGLQLLRDWPTCAQFVYL